MVTEKLIRVQRNMRLLNTKFPLTANKNALSEVTQLIEKGGKTRYQLS